MNKPFKSEYTLSSSGFLFDHSTGLTYTMNPVGELIFRLIEMGKDGRQILNEIEKEYDVDVDTTRKDLEDFYSQLKEFGLID